MSEENALSHPRRKNSGVCLWQSGSMRLLRLIGQAQEEEIAAQLGSLSEAKGWGGLWRTLTSHVPTGY